MPTFTLSTNLPTDKIPDSFEAEITDIIAENLGKPVPYICVFINADQRMTFAKTRDPCAVCRLESIGKIDKDSNKKYTQVLMEKINSSLGIAMDRMYITFCDLERPNVGFNGKTFA